MLVEKKTLYTLVEDALDNQIVNGDLRKVRGPRFKSFLRRDQNDCYCVVDSESSIKLVFDQTNLKEYLAGRAGEIDFDSFDSKLFIFTLRARNSLKGLLF